MKLFRKYVDDVFREFSEWIMIKSMLDLSCGAKLLISLRRKIMSFENLSQNINEYYIELII
jgi:hypothetical protein